MPGVGSRAGGERLIGSAVGLTKHRVAPSQRPDMESGELTGGLNELEPIFSAVLDASDEAEAHVEAVRHAAADAWAAYDDLTHAATPSGAS